MKTLGKKISDYRKMRNMTQEELAERMNVSSQAVSKWENDLSIPDLPTLIGLADLFGVTMDELVRQEEALPVVQVLPEGKRKPVNQMLLRIVVDSDGDHVKVNLPVALVKAAMESGVGGSFFQINDQNIMKMESIDWDDIFAMIDKGVMGKIVEVDSADGDHVEVYVE